MNRKDVEGKGPNVIEITSWDLAAGTEESHETSRWEEPVFWADIWTCDLENMSQACLPPDREDRCCVTAREKSLQFVLCHSLR
jgi:hypothetical protein